MTSTVTMIGDTVTWTVETVSAVQIAADAVGQGELFAS
jgi:hypothetical protein